MVNQPEITNPQETSSGELPSSIKKLQDLIASANGREIPLIKPSNRGEKMYLKVIAENFPPDPEIVEHVRKRNAPSLSAPTGLNFSYVFVESSDGELQPVGRYLWAISGREASALVGWVPKTYMIL